ncbi:MAG: hypothetical protein MJ175_08855, partial [Clostridia bacterium]|nr:hypothetical protein [Clostridia bacterium]
LFCCLLKSGSSRCGLCPQSAFVFSRFDFVFVTGMDFAVALACFAEHPILLCAVWKILSEPQQDQEKIS